MARLAGKFVGLLRVSVDADQADTLAATLRALDAGGLSIVVERSAVPAAAEPPRLIWVELIGHDHPGIVHDIARALARQGVNIEELETDLTSAPMSGETLFRARARLSVPVAVAVTQIRSVLEALAGELMVELAVAEAADD